MNLRIKHIASVATLTLVTAAMLAPAAQARPVQGALYDTVGTSHTQGWTQSGGDRFGRLITPTHQVATDRLTRDFPANAVRGFPGVVRVSGPASSSGVDWTAVIVAGSIGGGLLIALAAGARILGRGARQGSLAT